MTALSLNCIIKFFTTTLWELEPDDYTGFKRHGVKYLQILALVIKDFWDDQCMLRASALSFTTILSLVPFFALTFSVLKGLGVQNKLEPLILDQVAAGSHEIVDKIVSYINNTNMTSLGAVGLVALIMTVISLLGTIEEAFNVIWGVRETRTLYRKFSDYLSVMVSGPILLVAATSITTSMQSQTIVKWLIETTYVGDLLLFLFNVAPYVIISFALVFLYIFIPNTTVRFKSALIGGILAGTAWQFAQWCYIHFQVGVAKYNAIYGTLAVLPIFMVWVYTSWLIVLFGVEVVYAHQNIRTFRREVRNVGLSHGLREFLTLAILQKIAVSFSTGASHWSANALAEELDCPARVIRELLTGLTATGYLVETVDEPPSYFPARALDQIIIKDLLLTLRHSGSDFQSARIPEGNEQLLEILKKVEASAEAVFVDMTLADLAVLQLAGVKGAEESSRH